MGGNTNRIRPKKHFPGHIFIESVIYNHTISLKTDPKWYQYLPEHWVLEADLKGNVSILRNPILGNIFFRLHIVEILGTGIVRIREAYKNSDRKPVFEILENSINVILPVMSSLDLTEDEAVVYKVLSKVLPRSISEITAAVPFGKSKTTVLLKRLADKNIVTIEGTGRGTKYKL